MRMFQSAPPHGGRPADEGFAAYEAYRFNPRPRTGGDSRCRSP